MRHHHEHTHPPGDAEPADPAEPGEPAEPGYPEHPEQPDQPDEHEHAEHAEHAEHGDHAGHGDHVAMFRRLFWISLLLTIPTVIWGHMLPELTGLHVPGFPGSDWIAPVLGTVVFLYGGRVFLSGALGELRQRQPGMMTLISLAIVVAFGFSVAVLLGFRAMPLWEELATLITVMLLGHWMEMRSISRARGALRELAKLLPDRALRIVDGGTEEVSVDELREGDVVLVRPGDSVPADGVVREGRSTVDESMITGESRPIGKEPDEEVIAGTVNGTGSLRVEVRETGEGTALAGIMRLVEEAQGSGSRAQTLADRAAFLLTIVAIGAGIVTLVTWLLLGASAAFTIERVVTTLVIACPHALGLAIPLVIAISTTVAARNGLLVRDRRGLEQAREITTVVFDKTGTLTRGEHRVVEIVTVDGLTEEEALRLGAAVEQDSGHPVARAIVESARERGIDPASATGFESMTGRGVKATVDGREVMQGGPNLLRSLELEPPEPLREAADRFSAQGQGAIYQVEGGEVRAVLAVADQVRAESAEAVERLHETGIEVAMITGDAQAVADGVARELGIDTVLAEVLPDRKAEEIRKLQAGGARVAMVGDGVNDAPALATADVGIAIGAGTQVAVEAGDIVLVRNDPRDVARIIELSRRSYRKMVQNLWWAAGYNVVAIPLAAGVLAGWGFILHPALGAILMSASTVIVALNAQLLRRVHI